MVIKFCENVLRRLEERKKIYERKILSGSFQTLEEYKLSIGKYLGIEETEIILKEIYKSMFEVMETNRVEESHE